MGRKGQLRIITQQPAGSFAGAGYHLCILYHAQEFKGTAASGLGIAEHIADAAKLKVSLCNLSAI